MVEEYAGVVLRWLRDGQVRTLRMAPGMIC